MLKEGVNLWLSSNFDPRIDYTFVELLISIDLPLLLLNAARQLWFELRDI